MFFRLPLSLQNIPPPHLCLKNRALSASAILFLISACALPQRQQSSFAEQRLDSALEARASAAEYCAAHGERPLLIEEESQRMSNFSLARGQLAEGLSGYVLPLSQSEATRDQRGPTSAAISTRGGYLTRTLFRCVPADCVAGAHNAQGRVTQVSRRD